MEKHLPEWCKGMSTCNFSLRHNSQYIYAFCDHSDFEQYVEENKDCWGIESEEDLEAAKYQDGSLYSDWYDEEKEYYLNWLEEELNKRTAYGTGLHLDFTEVLGHRITDGDEVATVRKYVDFAGGTFEVMAAIDFEAGYYEGFALDWRVKNIEGASSYWHSSFDYLPDVQDCVEMLHDETELNEGLCRALALKLQTRLEAALNEITTAMEEALKTICPYHLTGFCMSNGEGIYTNHKKAS